MRWDDDLRMRRLREHDWRLRRLWRERADTRRELRRREDADRELERRADDLDRRTRDAAGGGGGDGGWFTSRPRDQDLDDRLLAAAVPVAGLAAVPLAVGHLAAFLTHGSWPRYQLHEAPGIVGRVLAHPGDPGRAWEPVNTGAEVPGPVGWWATLALVVVIAAAVALLAWGAVQRRPRAGARRAWAGGRDVRHHVVRRGDGDRLVVGTMGDSKLGLTGRHSLLVVGPAHTGKTSGLTVPAVLEWSGPVIVATSKGHLVDETIGWRSHQGDVHVYDPAAVTRYHRSGWSVLAGCGTWSGAIRTASDLTHAARAATAASSGAGHAVFAGRGDLWQSSVSLSLAPYLLAAVASGRSIRAVVDWIEREEHDEVAAVLDGIDRTAAWTHRTTLAGPDPDRSAFLHGMHQILSVYADPTVSPSMDRHDIVPDELLDGGSHTLYLTAPEQAQARFRPLCATVLRQVLAAAFERSSALGGPLDPPLLVLDDAVGVAPVDDLASLASTAAARGIQLVSVFQDVRQITGHYGDRADAVVQNHAAILVTSGRRGHAVGAVGAGAASAAGAGSAAAGAGAVGRAGVGDGGAGSLLHPSLAAQLGPFEAALLYDTPAPIRVRLRSWLRDRELRRRAETPQDAVEPAEPPAGERPDDLAADRPDPLEQTAAWLTRARGRVGRGDDPTIPLDTDDPDYIEVFGRLDEEDGPPPTNVTPLSNRFRR